MRPHHSSPRRRAAASLGAHAARAALNVFACEPEWGALATALGGDDVSVFTATDRAPGPASDPGAAGAHLASALRRSRGLHRRRARDRLDAGAAAPGRATPRCSRVSPAISPPPSRSQLLEKPAVLDRAEGDVHPAGNPHIQTDPRNIRIIAAALAKRLAEIDPAHAAGYAARDEDIRRRARPGDAALARRWPRRSRARTSSRIHKDLDLSRQLPRHEARWRTIEPKPGVPPGSAYIAELLDADPAPQCRA